MSMHAPMHLNVKKAEGSQTCCLVLKTEELQCNCQDLKTKSFSENCQAAELHRQRGRSDDFKVHTVLWKAADWFCTTYKKIGLASCEIPFSQTSHSFLSVFPSITTCSCDVGALPWGSLQREGHKGNGRGQIE